MIRILNVVCSEDLTEKISRHMKNYKFCLLLFYVFFIQDTDAEPVVIYAAASLNTAVTETIAKYPGGKVKTSFASSSTLAKQIYSGASADIFFSANKQWMDYLVSEGLIEKSLQRNLLGNELVLISQSKSGVGSLDWNNPKNLISALRKSRLAIGDPTHVPVGLYAKQVFQSLGWWEQIKTRLAPAPNVLAALNYVVRGECEVGVVYITDTFLTDKVKIVGKMPKSLHSPIIYSVGVVAGRDSPQVREFFEYLASSESIRLFVQKGFSLLDSEVVVDVDG